MTEILLVHGAWHGPWCWEPFVERVRQAGHSVRCVLLRDHDRASGRIWHRVSDYVDDLQRAAELTRRPPILVGHSLGGLVVQKYLERRPAAGAVLMASLPPGGAASVCWRLLRRYPLTFIRANLCLSLRPFITRAELVRELFFTSERPLEPMRGFMSRLRDESYLAFLDAIFFALPRPERVRTPMLVLGAAHDGFLTVRDVERTAQAYGNTAEIFPMGHDMMLDKGWTSVADRIAAWASAIDARQDVE
jgi:pimeloyl-ACP methyl ester carboxylesterase